MTVDDLSRTLADAVETGKVGTPVSLRAHLQLSELDADLFSAMAALLRLCCAAGFSSPANLQSRRSRDSQINVLLQTSAGQTLSFTFGRGSAVTPSLHLLLIGNHGTVRLEGGDLVQPPAAASSEDRVIRDACQRAVRESLASRQAVPTHFPVEPFTF